MDVANFEQHFQITDKNPLVGAGSRVNLLKSVGSSLLSLPKIFGENGRPGNLVGVYKRYITTFTTLTHPL
jgi:hypothetical protein